MTSFTGLSALVRAFFALWALLLCLANIGSTVLSVLRKRVRFAVFSALLFLPVYLLWQVIFDISLNHGAGARLNAALGGLPWLFWLGGLLVFTALSALLMLRLLKYDQADVSPNAIKRFLDGIPCGVCCYRDDGRVIFSNVCMNRLSEALTGESLLNANLLSDAAADRILTVEERVWRFSGRDIEVGGETLHEMIASDVTVGYAKTRALEEEKAELSALSAELKAYYAGIDETVRRQEILQAKVNIHDEMNRLMLSSTAADSRDTAELDRIFRLWDQNALLLGMEAEEAKEAASDSLEAMAEALKIRLTRQDAVPDGLSDGARNLISLAAREALINAVKHAAATAMTISFHETADGIDCRFTNDGKVPAAPVRLTGGLANLSRLAALQGASVSAMTGDDFTLILHFPKTRV